MRLFLKNLLWTLVAPGTIAGYVPWWMVRDRELVLSAWTAAAAVNIVLGVAIYLWCVWDFASYGRATPAPIDAPKRLVVRGLYRYVRNPIYVGVLSIILGWAMLFQAAGVLIYGVCVAAAFHLFVVLYEEPQLARDFGGEYEVYRSRVGRWIPRL